MKYQILAMIERGTKGSIVNTASVAGVVGEPIHGEYVGAKHAVVGLRSEEHTSELQSLMRISYAVFCLKKKKMQNHSLYDTASVSKYNQQNQILSITQIY